MKSPPAELIFQQLTHAFAASQDYPRADVQRRQSALLERLVRHARAEVPFYRDSRRLEPLFRADGTFDLAGWADVPILTRIDAHENEAALQALSVPPDMGPLERDLTSGSTGTPLHFTRTLVQRVASEVLLNRALRWHGAWPMTRFAMIRGKSQVVSPSPGLMIVPGGVSLSDQLGLLQEHRTTHVLVTPSIAAGWAELDGARDLPELTTIITTGEILRPEVRSRIEQRLKVKVVNLYSTSELGPIAAEGPDGRGRVHEEIALLEGPHGAFDPRAYRQVVVTPFYGFGMPLIRYAPGDYVRFSIATAKQAPGLRRLDEVVGRQRNLFRHPDGSLFLPARFIAKRLQAIVDCRSWQLVQTSLTDVTLKIVVAQPPTTQQASALNAYVQSCLPNHTTDVAIVDAIENDMRSGKGYEMFLSLVDGLGA